MGQNITPTRMGTVRTRRSHSWIRSGPSGPFDAYTSVEHGTAGICVEHVKLSWTGILPWEYGFNELERI